MTTLTPKGDHPLFSMMPVRGITDVTPDDATDLASLHRGLYHGAATPADIKVTLEDGSETTLVNLAPGVWHPLFVTRVWATGTTATNIRVAK